MKKPVILIVEDEESLVSFIAEELKYENYEVLIAADGQEALTLFDVNEERVNLLLLDWMLPKIDGLTVARKIPNDDCQRSSSGQSVRLRCWRR